MQISQMKEFLLHNREAQKVIPEDTLGKLAFLDTDLIDQEQFPQLSCIPEINSTGQKLSHYHVLKLIRDPWKEYFIIKSLKCKNFPHRNFDCIFFWIVLIN